MRPPGEDNGTRPIRALPDGNPGIREPLNRRRFAIPGPRSLYSPLAGMVDRSQRSQICLAFVPMIVGLKMMTHHRLKRLLGQHFSLYLLAVVLRVLLAGILASLLKPARPRPAAELSHDPGL